MPLCLEHTYKDLALQIKRRYCGLSVQETVAFMISRCGNCNQRQAKTTRAPLRPIICTSFWTRVQVDLEEEPASVLSAQPVVAAAVLPQPSAPKARVTRATTAAAKPAEASGMPPQAITLDGMFMATTPVCTYT